ncbi:MAG: YraN family protein [Bacteroidales bacterium]|nr:YraN family protein [Bacteroidales bacterium]
MAEHNTLGKEGEKIAEKYLISKGYSILERNWFSTHKELDIIAGHKGWIIIVEVKTRTGYTWEPPEDAVNTIKIKRIVKAANHYLCLHQIDAPVRFDIISVIHEKDSWIIEHFEDAFLAPYK